MCLDFWGQIMLVDVYKIGKDFGFGEVFSSISFSVNYGDRIAIVGRNGCGKSTCLRAIAGTESYIGTINLAKNLKIGFLEQTAPDNHDDRLVEDILHEPFRHFNKTLQQLKIYEEKMCTISGKELDKLVEKYSDLQEKFIADGGYDIENSINYVVNGLKIDSRIRSQKYSTLSGGEKTLVHFARILLDDPDLLLLDEPTNHLDIERVEWLESYLNRFKGGVVIVSHDRYFLDKVAKRIIDLEDNGEKYEGNYSYFVKEKENKQLREFEVYKNEQKKIEELKKAAVKLREWGEKADNPTMFRRAKAIERRIDDLEANAIQRPKDRKNLPIDFGKTERSGHNVVNIENFSLILGDKILFDNASANVYAFDKIALVGKNGIGKSSLLKCILGEITDYDGKIKMGSSVTIGYLPQILSFENDNESILDYVSSKLGITTGQARSILARFEFYKDSVEKSVGTLSGGEKIRVKLACLLENKVNTLIFDEPTNHIDIFTREILEEAMKKFKGTILFVSHDRFFINSVANKIMEVKDAKVKVYEGNYDDYKHKDDVVVPTKEEKPVKIKAPKISKGGKW